MQKKLVDLVAKSRADFCEIRVEKIKETAINFQGKKLDSLKLNYNSGGAIRVFIDGGWGFTSFNSLDNLETKLKQAEEQAKFISQFKKENTNLAPVKPILDQIYVSYREDPNKVSLEEKIELLENYNSLYLNSHEKIIGTRIIYFDKHKDWYLANSEGTYIYQEKMDLGGHLGVSASDGIETVSEGISFGSSNDFSVTRNLDDAVRETAQRVVELLYAPTIKGGEYTVILDPEMAGLFIHEAFGHLSEADDIYADKNLAKLMALGNRYGGPILNVYDSGLETGARGFLKYDDEGVPTEKTYILKGGLLVGHLHSRESAAMMEAKPTGNARALDYRFPPICRMRTTCIENGTTPFSEMLADVEEGVYAVGGYGGETNGELFTFTASRGYMIRGGQVAEMVKNVSLSGNVFHTLNNIDKIGNDFIIKDNPGGCGKGEQVPLPTSEGAPHIRIKNVVVGGEGQ